MNVARWIWLPLLVVPGCLLVQPLDDVKAGDDDSVPSAHAGMGQHAGGNGPGAGGAGNKAGSGPVASGGSGATGGSGPVASGGAGNAGAFSLFLGEWTISNGTQTTSCDGGTPTTSTVSPGGTDTFGVGTLSDLILDPGTSCEILVDVDGRTASLNPATLDCTTSDANYDYDLFVESYDFTVSSDGKTAKASMTATVYLTDANSNESVCTTDTSWDYER